MKVSNVSRGVRYSYALTCVLCLRRRQTAFTALRFRNSQEGTSFKHHQDTCYIDLSVSSPRRGWSLTMELTDDFCPPCRHTAADWTLQFACMSWCRVHGLLGSLNWMRTLACTSRCRTCAQLYLYNLWPS